MSSRKAVVIGTGMGVPNKVLTNYDLEKMVETTDEWIVSRSGIRERRITDNNTSSGDLGIIATQEAIAASKISASDIDLILVSTVTPDMIFPSTACIIQHAVNATNAAAFDLEAGCSGFCYCLSCAQAYIESGLYKTIIVVGAETLSKITDWTDRKTCVLFGDGAGAVILQAQEGERGILYSLLGADGSGKDLLHCPSSGSRMPITHETIDSRLNFIKMEGSEIFKFGVRIMEQVVPEAIEKAGLTPEDISLYVPHQANIRIIESAAKRLKVGMDKMFINLDKYGNTSSASIPICLAEAERIGRIKQGDLIMTIGFGAGLTYAANIIRW